MSGHLEDVTIKSLAYGGDAVGRLADGRTVFIPFLLPGERATIELVEEKEHFARGRPVTLLEAAPGRVKPRCKHFGRCGGCQYQHLEYTRQLESKASILREQLTRIGRIPEPPAVNVIRSQNAWNYRNHLQFHVAQDGSLAFVAAPQQRNEAPLVRIEECHLPEPNIGEAWPQVQIEPGTAIERVSLRSGTQGDVMLTLESSSPSIPELEIEAPASIAHVYNDDVVVQAGADHTLIAVLDREFRVSPTAFFQVNIPVAERMVEHVLARVSASCEVLLDAYCGVGLFSAFLAPRCKKLIGIESSPAACEDFAFNLDEYDNVELYEDTVEHVIPALGEHPQVVVLDPPRAGVAREALDAFLGLTPEAFIYISCDPATLARDAWLLGTAGYHLEDITLFDLFPQTYHIESIGVFAR